MKKEDKTIVFTSEDCGTCQEVKKKLKETDVEVIDVTTEEARKIMYEMLEQKVKFYTIPQCVQKKDGKYELCDIKNLVEK